MTEQRAGDVAAATSEPGVSGAATSDAEAHDSLPDELDPSAFVGPYLFPNNSRRRIPGVIYIVAGACAIALSAASGGDAVLVNGGFAAAGVALVLFGLYCIQAGWHLAVDENDALVAAAREANFPVGHASAQLAWRGLRSRPTWRILLYSNEPSPQRRGLVLIDGVDAATVGCHFEDNPEDWTLLEG